MLIDKSLRSLLLAPLLCAPAAFTQQAAPAKSAPAPIQLDVVVTPKAGAPVANLQQGDFTVLDNKAPQPILSFEAVTGSTKVPVEVILVIDAVNMPFQQLAYERTQIGRFLRANGGRLAYPTALMFFTDTGTQIQNEPSGDGNALAEALDKFAIGLRDITRSTGVYGAEERLDLSLGAIQALVARETPRPGRKIVLWLSPGWPILSGPGIELDAKQQQGIFGNIVDLSTQLREARITLYSLDSLGVDEGVGRTNYYQDFIKGVSKSSQTQLGNLSLQVLAVQSGGFALTSTGVAQLLQQCITDIEPYYVLSFAPAPAERPNEYHHIEVQVSKPGLIARTRQGYYAQP